MLERIENESFWLRCPAFADIFEGREALQSLEPTSEVIGCDEVREMLSKRAGRILGLFHAGDDSLACKDYIRAKLGLPAFAPQRSPLTTVPGIDIAPQATPEPALDPNPNGERARLIWCETADIRDSIAERYLNSRHLILDDADWYRVLRFHPACLFGLDRAPAMIALMRDVLTDEPKCIHCSRDIKL